MSDETFDFRWHVETKGYRWDKQIVYDSDGKTMQKRKKAEWVLTDDAAIGDLPALRLYAPFEERNPIYLTFSQIDRDDRDKILAFAQAYGMLGIGVLSDSDIRREQVFAMRRPVETWYQSRDEIDEMRWAVSLWSWCRERNIAS